MDAPTIYSTTDVMQAEAACEQLRSHGIKCGSVETSWSGRAASLDAGFHSGVWDVIVRQEDVERATQVLRAWPGSESSEGVFR